MSETTPNVWPLPDVQRARDYLEVALSIKAVLMQHEVELLADLDAECARRTGSTPTALDRLLWNSRRCQTTRERTIAAARRRLVPVSRETTTEAASVDALAALRADLEEAEREWSRLDAQGDKSAAVKAAALVDRIEELRQAIGRAERKEAAHGSA